MEIPRHTRAFRKRSSNRARWLSKSQHPQSVDNPHDEDTDATQRFGTSRLIPRRRNAEVQSSPSFHTPSLLLRHAKPVSPRRRSL